MTHFLETSIQATEEEVNGVKKTSILDVKKALIDNGAIIEDDVILREIGHDIMNFY